MLSLNGKATTDKAEELFQLVHAVLSDANLDSQVPPNGWPGLAYMSYGRPPMTGLCVAHPWLVHVSYIGAALP